MNLRRFLKISLCSLLLSSSACSVYKSSGRNSFESKAPDNVRTTNFKPEVEEENNQETCWNQPASDPLWHVDSESKLLVTQLNDDEIQVCLQAQ